MISKQKYNQTNTGIIMTILRYSPWQEMDSVQSQINQMLNDIFVPNTSSKSDIYAKYPVAELTETDEALLLKLEIPGMDKNEIEIEATTKSISISGDRKSEVAENTENKTYSEFRYGSFQRVIALPVRIQNTEVKAEYRDGILHLTLLKAEAEKNKVVKVNLLGE